MAFTSEIRSGLGELSRNYGLLLEDLDHHRHAITTEAAAQRAPIMSVLGDLIDHHLQDVDDPALSSFNGVPDERGNAFDVAAWWQSKRRAQTRAQRAYEPVAAYDRRRKPNQVAIEIAENQTRQRRVKDQVAALAPIAGPLRAANHRLAAAGAPPISEDTITEYERFNLKRALTDPNYDTARRALATYRRAINRADRAYAPLRHLADYEQATADKAKYEVEEADLKQELDASDKRDQLLSDDDIRRDLAKRVVLEARSAVYVEKLATDPISKGRLTGLLANAIKAEALDRLAGELSTGMTAAEVGRQRIENDRLKLPIGQRQINGSIRQPLHEFQARASQLRTKAAQAIELSVAVRDYNFGAVDPPQAAGFRRSNMVIIYHHSIMAADLLSGMSAPRRASGLQLLGVSQTDFSSYGIDPDRLETSARALPTKSDEATRTNMPMLASLAH
ncbi:MAG: hypothetical protein AAF556_05460 [Pseudomonadota bacterium]